MKNDNFSPKPGNVSPRFCGIRSFFRFPIIEDVSLLKNVDAVLTGVPFDGGTSFRPGARFAPEHIRSMSVLGRGYYPHLERHLFKSLKVVDGGDMPVFPQDINKTHAAISKHVKQILEQQSLPILVGGDHSISIGSLEAVYKHFGPVGIVHFDAHTDTFPSAWGCDNHHGTFMRHGFEKGWFKTDSVLQVGIRGPFSTDNDFEVENKYGFKVCSVDDIRSKGLAYFEEKLSSLKAEKYYLSFDVDCLDPAFAPGTGTPVPGGLTSWEVMQMIRKMRNLRFVCMDLVEVSPAYDAAGMTSLAAVYVLSEMIALLASKIN